MSVHCGPKLSFKDQSRWPLEALFSRLPASEKNEHDSLYLEAAKWQNGKMAIFPVFKDDAFRDGSGGGDVAKNFG